MNMWLFHQNGFARMVLSTTVSKFVEENNLFPIPGTQLQGHDSLSNTME